VTGQTESTNFPTFAAFQTTLAGPSDAFVASVNATGSPFLIYSSYLGGASIDFGTGVAVDAAGHAYVAGQTGSNNFPTTVGAFQTTYADNGDVFVAKVSAVGFPATLTLTPSTATNPVGTQHCVTATATDGLNNPTPGIVVRFTVAGAVTPRVPSSPM
jgi:hypothetical protein